VVVDEGTAVDVAHARFTDARAPVARELARIATQGGRVRVLVGPHPEFLGRDVRLILDEAGVPLLRADIHDKLALVHSRHAISRRRRKLVLSGSHNLNHDANYRNDEILVKTFHDELYDDMRDNHFARLWAAGRPVTDEPTDAAEVPEPSPQPPAMAPITMNGSLPLTTSSGSASSGASWEMSSSQA
jgi:phosphatidylserine/phosphatidylglycerophosphate/cardiolipin synthase-like enzyme